MDYSFKIYRRLSAVVTLIAGVVLTCVSEVSAENITLKTAGTLKNLLTNPSEIKELTLSGPIDASDIRFMAKEMTELNKLDLSGCKIVAYDDEVLEGRTSYPSDEIPALIFCGTGLKQIELPKSGKLTLGAGSFAGTKLEEVVIPDNVAKVSDGAFAGCQELKSVSVGRADFGRGIFEACEALLAADVSRAETTGEAMFRGCTNLKKVNGSEKLMEIADRTFENCDSLSTVSFGSTLCSIGSRAFAGSGLVKLNLKECSSLQEMGEGVLAACPKLVEVTFGPALTEVKFAALLGDRAVSDVEFPKALAILGDYAMGDMAGLKSLNASALTTPPATGENVWAGVDQPSVTLSVAEGLGQTFKQAEQWREFNIVEIAGTEDPVADRQSGVEWSMDGSLLTVKSRNNEITGLKVFTDGGSEVISLTPNTEEVVTDLAPLVQKIFIISVKTSDGTTTVIKAARR